MKVILRAAEMRGIEAHGEATYPNEGAGFLFGRMETDQIVIEAIRAIENRRETEAQFNRYELSPQDFVQAELEASRREMDIIGVFHSHPDHPAAPSQFDLEHALPSFSYLITSVQQGQAKITRAWRLQADRAAFEEDELVVKVETGS